MKQFHHGINRYIMECKYSPLVVKRNVSSELIDTLWNVNAAVSVALVNVI